MSAQETDPNICTCSTTTCSSVGACNGSCGCESCFELYQDYLEDSEDTDE